MTNPTIITQDSAYRGFTFDGLVERLLASRGLTLDSTTGRTEATAGEIEAAQIHLRRAFDFCALEFPSLWNIRTYTATWTSGDHSIALPANMMVPLAVTYDGYSLKPLNRTDYYRLLRDDDSGGNVGASGRPAYYRTTGYSDQDTGETEGDRDWRIVMQIHPTPGSGLDTKTFTVEYLALAGDYESVDATEGGDPVALYPFLQSWVLERSKELWSAENGDSSTQSVAEKERAKAERSIDDFIQGTRQRPSRFTPRYPNVTRRRRYRL